MTIRIAALAAAAAAIVATGAFAQEDAVKARQGLMKAVGDNTKIVGAMLQGKAPFDAAAAAAAATVISTKAADFPNHFPEGSTTGDTEALPIIWTQFDDFKAKSMKLSEDAKAAAAAAGTGEDAFKAAAGAMLQNCKSCHEVYRKPS